MTKFLLPPTVLTKTVCLATERLLGANAKITKHESNWVTAVQNGHELCTTWNYEAGSFTVSTSHVLPASIDVDTLAAYLYAYAKFEHAGVQLRKFLRGALDE